MGELTPKKHFGQNFLVNPGMQNKVIAVLADIIDKKHGLSIVEIGPGRGDLTQHIVEFDRQVLALEIDKDAVELLENKFEKQKNFVVLECDAMKLLAKSEKEVGLILPKQFVLFANLPFNVGSRILMDLPIYFPGIEFAVILQKEVIKKFNKKNSLTFFGAFVSLFWDLQSKFDISKGNFFPSPKVTSSMVVGIPKGLKYKTFKKRKKAQQTLKKLFIHPKKTVANNLKNLGWGRTQIEGFFKETGFEDKIRLNWDNYEEVLSAVLDFEGECSKNK